MAKKKSEKVLVNKFVGKEDDDELIRSIENKLNTFKHDTREIRRQWLVNGAFARTQQWNVLHATEDRLIWLTPQPGRKQVTDDMIRPWRQHRIANMIAALPRFKAVPEAIADPRQVSGARYGTALLNHYWDRWQFVIQYLDIASYVVDFGNAFAFVNYIENSQNYQQVRMVDAGNGDTAIDEDGQPVTVQTRVGDLTSTILPPQCIACPLDTTPLSEKPWVIIYQQRDLDYFKEQYPDKGNEVKSETTVRMDDYHLSRIDRVSRNDRGAVGQEYANEIIYLQKPSDKCPEGMVVVMAGGVLLYRGEWPYKKLTTYPIVHFHSLKESGEFFARSDIEAQIPLQKSINLLWSSLIENAEDMAHIKWLIPVQANIADAPVDMPEVVYYNSPYKPEQAVPAPIPQYVFSCIGMLKDAIRDKQNYHGASLGTSVSGVRSEVHAQGLQDQDLLPLTTVDEIFRARFESLGEIILALAAEMLTTDRLITYTGDNRQLMIENFRGEFLADTKGVKIRLTNLHMRNRTATIQNIISFFQYGKITDQYGRPDGQRALELLEWSLPESEYADIKTHTELINQEHDKLLRGEFAPVLPWQSHKLHSDCHARFMNSPEFMKLFDDQEANQQTIANFVQHKQQHDKAYFDMLKMLTPPAESDNAKQTTS